ncbi:hypothetical protein CC86DRAFT_354864 [Ophiobolus disseminans]|uniref:MINDY deubiquitinase domain-containing protein n=1 Tax=Ophiobolus disseminans TaxID=1469910 RepID=A0A6A6ZRJ0_9PLEO|nr:hypothetical protein CC86DRAFT_354864 [Ophiobolus disseminans]
MVLRKEEPEMQAGLVPAPLSHANPPYPTSPLDEHPPAAPSSSANSPYALDPNKAPAFNIKTPAPAANTQGARHDDDSDFSDDEWNRSDDDDFEEVDAKDVPDALRPAGGKAPATGNALPDSLRPGPPAGIPIKRSIENISPMPTGASSASFGAMSAVSEQSNGSIPLQTNNPYLKAQQTGQSNWGGESSQQIWGESPAEHAKYDPVELPAYQTPTTPSHDMSNLNLHGNTPPFPRAKSPDQPPVIAVNSPTPLTSPQSAHPPSHSESIGANPWGPGADVSPSTQTDQERHHEPHSYPLEPTSSTNPFVSPLPVPPLEEQPPALPPRRSQEDNAHTIPRRPLDTSIGSTSTPGPESPNTRMNRQRKEHYQIKHIRWHDVNKPGIRTSPILTQNLNGPCPLLALVNALVLSTPSGIETALVETLRTREQVSLGLLLDAVFDELMSGRRGTAAQELPDVSDLYKFLLALHTGLNVNPLFVPETEAGNGNAMLTSHPDGRTGGFENTPDMKLYRTFNIPLLHGWLPEADSEAHAAFNRVAKSYDTSQYVQFQEEELDAKLQSGEPLTMDEQQMFTDIHAIKEFLGQWPTQLTDHGLNVMRDSIQQGQVAILFRNDHFSTLFKDPRTDKLLTLVTDQGYSGHDEIVWESLVDVNGQGSELYSGDFRPVGNNSMSPQQSQQEPSLIDTGDTRQNKKTTTSLWLFSSKKKRKTVSAAKPPNAIATTKPPCLPSQRNPTSAPITAARLEVRPRPSSRRAATTSQPTVPQPTLRHLQRTKRRRPDRSTIRPKDTQRVRMPH